MGEFDDIAAGARETVYAVFGKAASYVPAGGGTPVPCRILLDMRDSGARPDDGSPVVGQRTIQVRASEIALPAVRGVFTLAASEGGGILTIANRPRPVDANRDEWTMWAE